MLSAFCKAGNFRALRLRYALDALFDLIHAVKDGFKRREDRRPEGGVSVDPSDWPCHDEGLGVAVLDVYDGEHLGAKWITQGKRTEFCECSRAFYDHDDHVRELCELAFHLQRGHLTLVCSDVFPDPLGVENAKEVRDVL